MTDFGLREVIGIAAGNQVENSLLIRKGLKLTVYISNLNNNKSSILGSIIIALKDKRLTYSYSNCSKALPCIYIHRRVSYISPNSVFLVTFALYTFALQRFAYVTFRPSKMSGKVLPKRNVT